MIRTTVISDIVDGELVALIHPDVINRVLADVMAGARHLWIKRAQERLHSTAATYIAGLQEVELGNNRAVLTLLGALPNMLEDGTPSFSMHEALLGANVPVVQGPGQRGKRESADGHFYRAIPMRHQVPGTSGLGGGQVMGSQYFRNLPSALSGQLQRDLGKAVHAKAKRLTATTGMPGGGTNWGKRLPAGVGGAGLLKPFHTTDIYAGMVRQSKTYGKATQNTYTTFRTISTAHPEKFIHPGFAAIHLADEVQQYVERTLPKALMAVFAESL